MTKINNNNNLPSSRDRPWAFLKGDLLVIPILTLAKIDFKHTRPGGLAVRAHAGPVVYSAFTRPEGSQGDPTTLG